MLSTAWFSSAASTVSRWTDTVQSKVALPCSRQLSRYCKMLGGVDRFNKQLIATHMGMGRCKQRFQRALFLGWLLPAVGVLNVRIAFNQLWPEAISGELQREHKYLGYDKWVQLELGEALIIKYFQKAKDVQGTPRGRLRSNSVPHFAPHAPGPAPRFITLAGLPSAHPMVNIKQNPTVWRVPLRPPQQRPSLSPLCASAMRPQAIMIAKPTKGQKAKYLKGKGDCRLCVELAKQSTTIHVTGAPGRGKVHRARKAPPGKSRPGQTVWACKICKVRLCKAKCFHRWDHDTNCAPCNRVLSL